MTVRRRTLSRKATTEERLPVNVELWASAMVAGFWWVEAMGRRRWWQDFASVHGARLEAKVRQACPGTRPGWWYASGRLPPVPMLECEPEPSSSWYRKHVVIDGVKHWRLGRGWQVCQAEHLRTLGELDGLELRRYQVWRRRGFPREYRVDKFPDYAAGWFVHGCYEE